jgi:competence protein ComEA
VDTTPTLNRRRRLSIGAGVVLVLLALAIAVLVSALGPRGSSELVGPHGTGGASEEAFEPGSSSPESPPDSGDVIGPAPASSTGAKAKTGDTRPAVFVHIIGAVTTPGLYQLHEGDRAVDAVAAAGGLAPDADQAQLNLARFLSDGEQIIVPRVGEAPPPAAGGAAPPGTGAPGGTININTADVTALEDLPGVGPALAERIVLWREANGSFTAVEDLLNVTGIGQKKLDSLRDSVAL